MQLDEKMRFSGKEAACYLEARPEFEFIWKPYTVVRIGGIK